MNPNISLYLDFLRASAAVTVVIHHFRIGYFSGGYLGWFNFGDEAVMLFFIISGFVIAFVAKEKENDPGVFLRRRISRLLSVLLPSVLLAAFTELIVNQSAWGSDFFTGLILSVKNTLLFMTDNWNDRFIFSTNSVFWSLSYEFWYYILFLFIFLWKGRMRYFSMILLILFLGYKILLLFPVWLLGVFLFKETILISKSFARIGFILSSAFFISLLLLSGIIQPVLSFSYFILPDFTLENSGGFLYQYLIGITVMLNIFFAKKLFLLTDIKFNDKIVFIIRYLASISFSLYCFHMSVFYLFRFFFSYDTGSFPEVLGVLVICLFILAGIGQVVERSTGYPFSKQKIYNYLS